MIKTSKFSRLLYGIGLKKRCGTFDKEWDDKLNSLMEKETITNITMYAVIFSSGDTVWIANHPYASGYRWSVENPTPLRKHAIPSLKTMWKFEAFVIKYIEEKGLRINLYR